MSNSANGRSNVLQKITSFLSAVLFVSLIACRQKQPAEKIFPTPEDAVVSLVDAVKTDNNAELAAILGPKTMSAVATGDEVADRDGRDLFVAAYYQQASLSGDDTSKTLLIGSEESAFPIPVVKEGNGWHFDTAAGIDELRYRRIGRDEMAAINACSSYHDAQEEYAQKAHDGNPAGAYAQKFISTPGKQDGLFWNVSESQEPSPLGELVADAEQKGYTPSQGEPTPFQGYYFHILTAQGTNAQGGSRNYIVNGQMRKGFALVAFPAEYGKGGVMTFVVDQDGDVYEKDLGADTAKIAGQMNEFDPDSSWHNTE